MRWILTSAWLGLLFLGGPAGAETRYWVSVGSFAVESRAATVRDQATAVLPEPFQVASAETDSGQTMYRVVAGPYLSRELADYMLQAARKAGYADAWVRPEQFDTDSPAPASGVGPSGEGGSGRAEDGGGDDYGRPDTGDPASGAVRRAPDAVGPPDAVDLDAVHPDAVHPDAVDPGPDSVAPRKPGREYDDSGASSFVDEVPPGYQFHKLHRDASINDAWRRDVPDAARRRVSGRAPPGPAALSASLAAVAGPAAFHPQALPRALAVVGGVTEGERDGAARRDVYTRPLRFEVRPGEPIALPRFEHDAVDIRIDGSLDEAEWSRVPVVDEMKVVEPDLLVTPRYRTLLRMFYTERGLYVAFDNEQPAGTIVKRLSRRDDGWLNRDSVAFTLDTSGEGRYGYWMNLALGNNQVDGTILPERQYSRDWDGAWYGGTAEYEGGWTAEFFIPWSQMAMPDQGDTRRIGLYASRKVAHINERWGWPALSRSQARFMSELQPLALEAVNPKQQWSFFPYSSATLDAVEDEQRYKAGFDLFWRPSTNFQLTATANPDFGNVESDDVIVNLTAFETFFPEKRLFFLEGQEIFSTTPRSEGYSGEPVTLLNTRRIGGPARRPAGSGLSFTAQELGQPSELYGALKLTGQTGSLRYGMLGASEEDVKLHDADGRRLLQNGRDYGVARVLYEDSYHGAYRAVGWISTLVTHPEADSRVHGLDFHYLTAPGRWKYDGQIIYSDVDDGGEGGGGFLDVQYTAARGLRYKASIAHYDDELDINDLGYLRRNDATDLGLGIDWVRSGLTHLRDLEISPFLRYERNGEGLTTRAGVGSRVRFTLNNLDRVESTLAFFPQRYEDRNSFGNGSYRLAERSAFKLLYQTDTSRPLGLFLETGFEEDGVDGHLWNHRAGVAWRPVDRVNVELQSGYTSREGWLLHQEERNLTGFSSREWKPRMNLDFFLSARQQFQLALQWVGIRAEEQRFYLIPARPDDLIAVAKPPGPPDDFTISQLNVQLRYRWQIAPLSDLFVVYTRNGLATPRQGDFGELFQRAWDDPLGDQLVVKLRYRLGT